MTVVEILQNPCALCRKREGTQLCDFVVEYFWMSNQGRTNATCDLPMCQECSDSQSSHDFCPYHKKMLPDLKIKDPVLKKRIIRNQAQMLKEFWNQNSN